MPTVWHRVSRWLRPATVLCLTALLAACIARLDSTSTAPESGDELYLAACASCHGRDGKGGGPVAPALKHALPDLTRLSQRHGGVFPRTMVIQTITGERNLTAHGTHDMPVWSQRFEPRGFGATAAAAVYARRRIEMLTDYIESLQERDR